MSNPCKKCACCLTTTIKDKVRFWCSQGAFDFACIPDDNDLDFEYLNSICSEFDNMDENDE